MRLIIVLRVEAVVSMTLWYSTELGSGIILIRPSHFYYRALCEFVKNAIFFHVFPLLFLYFCPRDFFFFQIYENYCQRSPNNEILKTCLLRGLVQE